MSIPIWLSIEPHGSETRLMLSAPSEGTWLKARLPGSPAHPRSPMALFEALSMWCGRPLHAVIDAGAQGVRQAPEHWAQMLGESPELLVQVHWTVVPAQRQRDRFLDDMGDFGTARRLVAFGAVGQR